MTVWPEWCKAFDSGSGFYLRGKHYWQVLTLWLFVVCGLGHCRFESANGRKVTLFCASEGTMVVGNGHVSRYNNRCDKPATCQDGKKIHSAQCGSSSGAGASCRPSR